MFVCCVVKKQLKRKFIELNLTTTLSDVIIKRKEKNKNKKKKIKKNIINITNIIT